METTLKDLENPLKKHQKNPEKLLWIFIGHPDNVILMFLLLTLNIFHTFF